MRKVAFYTLGCKVNQYDSQAMLELFLSRGFESVDFHEFADVYVVNTCTVTGTADKKSRQMVSRAKKQNPNALVIAAGCMAQKNPDAFLALGVDAVIGADDRLKILDLLDQPHQNMVADISGQRHFEELEISTSGEKTRGYIKIQEGCNNYCTYCIIPYVRGPARSRDFGPILEEAARLADSGIKEIVLTGIHTDAYGIDKQDGRNLADIIEGVAGIGGVKRIRLGSLNPGCFTDDFLHRAAKVEKLCAHFHISLQSGSDTVLKRMNRRYTARDYENYINHIREHFETPAITTDIIAGFPQETVAEHRETCEFVKKIGFSRIHVFPYSKREGTVASRMEGEVKKAIKQQRTAELIAIGDLCEEKYMQSFVGKSIPVLFETPDEEIPGNFTGYSDRYVQVSAPGQENEIWPVTITGITQKKLIGKL